MNATDQLGIKLDNCTYVGWATVKYGILYLIGGFYGSLNPDTLYITYFSIASGIAPPIAVLNASSFRNMSVP